MLKQFLIQSAVTQYNRESMLAAWQKVMSLPPCWQLDQFMVLWVMIMSHFQVFGSQAQIPFQEEPNLYPFTIYAFVDMLWGGFHRRGRQLLLAKVRDAYGRIGIFTNYILVNYINLLKQSDQLWRLLCCFNTSWPVDDADDTLSSVKMQPGRPATINIYKQTNTTKACTAMTRF